MARLRTKLLILLCGMFISTSTPLCHAQDSGKLPEVNEQSPAVASALLPKTINTHPPVPAQAKTDHEVSETPWYWRFLGMITIGLAKYNTEKQSDGRPRPLDNSR